MTEDQVDAMITKIPDDLDAETRDVVMQWMNGLKDPVIGPHIEKLLRLAIEAGGWPSFLDSLVDEDSSA